jgi:NAD(P)-dependent dehydrogenase (short-subunit alcohol dehydrogenase family)
MLLGHGASLPGLGRFALEMATTSKAVLITGCSTGIGRATAEHLAAKDWTVYATARRPETLAELAQKGCRTLALDVTDEASMATAVAAVEAEEGAVGVLVNNAGYSQSGAVEDVPLDVVRRQFETNVFGLVRMCQLVLPGMRRQGFGRIVNVSSMGGKLVFPGGGFYHGTKFAVEAISDALRFEVKGFGVDVVVIEPGLILTNFGDTAAHGVGEATGGDDGAYAEFNAAVAKSTAGAYEDGPMAKLGGGPETVAKAIEKAITARRPKTRYKVTPSARMALATRRLLPDRGWDAFLRSQFPSPGKD